MIINKFWITLHKDIAQRINRQYLDIAKLDNEIEDFRYERRRLQKYYDLLNVKPPSNDNTIYEIFGAAERWKDEAKEFFINFKIENALSIGRLQINKSIEALEDFVTILGELPKDVRSTWSGYEPNTILPGEDEELKEIFEDILDETIRFIKIYGEKEVQCDPKFINDHIYKLRYLGKINYKILNEPPSAFNKDIAKIFLENKSEQALLDLKKQIGKKDKLSNEYNCLREIGYQWSENELTELKQKAKKVKSIGLGNSTVTKLKKVTAPASDLLELIDELQDETHNITWLFAEHPKLLSDYGKIRSTMKLMESAPPDIFLHPHPSHAMKISTTIYGKAQQEFLKLTDDLSNKSETFKIDKLPTHQVIVVLAGKIFSMKSFINKIFSSDYRKAKKKICEFLVSPKTFKDNDLGDKLLSVVSIQENMQKFNENEDNKLILGQLYKGMTTDWDRLKQLIE